MSTSVPVTRTTEHREKKTFFKHFPFLSAADKQTRTPLTVRELEPKRDQRRQMRENVHLLNTFLRVAIR